MGVAVSEEFARLYGEADFAETVRADWMPWLLDGIDLGADVMDLAAGPGAAVPSLRRAGRTVTVAQAAPAFTPELRRRFAEDADVDVVDVEPWGMPFDTGRFTAATAFLALHHVPSVELQDRTLRELGRVVRPGGLVAGVNALDGPHFRRMNTDGSAVPVEPLSFADRLRRAGFVDVEVTVWSFVRFVARVPTEPDRTQGASR